MSTFQFNHHWSDIQSLLKDRFQKLAHEDLNYVEGRAEELLYRLREKLSLNAEELEVLLSSLYGELQHTLKDKVAETKAQVGESYAKVCSQMKDWRQEGREYVRSNPRESLVAALFAGFVAGLLFRR